jgi:hypothetical protein
MKIKFSSTATANTEAAAGVSSTNGSNVGLATLVRVHNSGTTERLVTLETEAASPVLIGTFTIGGGKTELLDKEPTDEVFAAHAEVLLVGVAYYS